MSQEFVILMLSLLLLVGLIGFVWNLINLRGAARRGAQDRSRSRRRREHRSLLGADERRKYSQAQKALNNGETVVGARLLEEIGMPRQAISALEAAGLIDEAAEMLLRMRRPNRAGVLYARHGLWAKASRAFRLAKMPLEAAKCAREAGDLTTAAQLFLELERFEEAADCYVQMDRPRDAAHAFLRGGRIQDAMDHYTSAAAAIQGSGTTLALEGHELHSIAEHLGSGNHSELLLDVVLANREAGAILAAQLRHGMARSAAEVLSRCRPDEVARVVTGVEISDREALQIAEGLAEREAFAVMAHFYEARHQWTEAAGAYERLGRLEDALRCAQQGGLAPLAERLAERLKHLQESKPSEEPQPQTGGTRPANDEPPPPEASPAVAARRADLETTFLQAGFVRELELAERSQLWRIARTIHLGEGDLVLDFDEQAPGIHIILSGAVGVYKEIDGDVRFVDEMGPCESFGEFWLLVEIPTRVRFVANEAATLAVIEREPFNQLLDAHGALARKVYRRFTYRLLRRLITPRNDNALPQAS